MAVAALILLLSTLVLILIGTPVAVALAGAAVLTLAIAGGADALQLLPGVLYGSIEDFTLISVPMFLMMGAAIAATPASADLYEGLHRLMRRIPGGLLVATVCSTGVFAALTGTSMASSAAIGKVSIPETRKRGYPAGISTATVVAGGTLGILIPPSITMIVYGVATQTSIGALFLAGVVPGLILVGLFSLYVTLASWRQLDVTIERPASLAQKTSTPLLIFKVTPFVFLIVALLWVMYGGIATPSEAAGVAAFLSIVLAVAIYRLFRLRDLLPIMIDTLRESSMIMILIAASGLFAYALSYLYITQSAAEALIDWQLAPWALMILINIFLLVAGCFLPPVSVILMTMPILGPMVVSAGFDKIWFGVMLTINMELALITPPVGANLYIVKGIVPDVPLGTILKGCVPFIAIMIALMVAMYFFPGIATWLPSQLLK